MTPAKCIFCGHEDDLAAALGLVHAEAGTPVLCTWCGSMAIATSDGLRPVAPGEREVPGMAVIHRDLARRARERAGFVLPAGCPGCHQPMVPTNHPFSRGLLPRDRVFCSSCYTLFIASPDGTIRPVEPGDLIAHEAAAFELAMVMVKEHRVRRVQAWS